MTTLLKKIEEDTKIALKAGEKDKVVYLRMLNNSAKLIAKNDKNRSVTDEDVINAALKTIKSVNETKDILTQRDMDASECDREISIVSEYLPKQLEFIELRNIIHNLHSHSDCPEGKAAKGYIMKNLNAEYRGQFDNKTAQIIINEL